MTNYVIIGPRGDSTCTVRAVFGDVLSGRTKNARLLTARIPQKGFERLLYRVSVNRRLNRIVRMPLRHHWELSAKEIAAALKEGAENIVVFCVSTRIFELLRPNIVRDLRALAPDVKTVYYLIDSVERTAAVNGVPVEKITDFFRQFDSVCTYDARDEEKYGYTFAEIPIYHAPRRESACACDLYFSGRDKARGDMLVAVYDRVAAAGGKCRFRVAEPEKRVEREGIFYPAWENYDELIGELLGANCILEIQAPHNSGPTLRYKEAVLYNKKLLTTNADVRSMPHYDPRWMRVIENAADVDPAWVTRREPVDYGYAGEFSAEAFLKAVRASLT